MGKEVDLTAGSIPRTLLVFGVPLLILNLCQTLYNTIDILIVGRYGSQEAITGVTLGGQINTLATMLAIGLATGCSVLISQYIGASQRDRVKRVISTSWCIMILCALCLTAILLIWGAPILRLIGTPKDSFDEALAYLHITALGLLFVYLFNHISAVLRGYGDSKRPLLFVVISSIIHVPLTLLFVAVFRMGAGGAAMATSISQGISVLIAIIYLRRQNHEFQIGLYLFQMDLHDTWRLLRLSLPVSLQNTATNVSYTILYSLVNTFGSAATAGVGITSRLSGFATLPGLAVSTAISTIAAQSIGAGNQKRARDTMYIGLGLSLAASLAFFAAFEVFTIPIITSFAPGEPDVIAVGVDYLRIISVEYVLTSVLNCQNSLIIGAGQTTVPMISSMVNAVIVRLPLAFFFALTVGMGVSGVAMGNAIAPLAAILISSLYIRFGRWGYGLVRSKA